jgi:glycosyltransferase involved in cell wall biosynthesis
MAEAGHQVCIVAGRGAQTNARVSFAQVPDVDSRSAEVLAIKASLDRGRIPAGFQDFLARIEAELRPIMENADWVIAHNVCSLNKNLPLTAALHALSQDRTAPGFILWHHDLAWTTPRYQDELHDGYPWDLLKTDWPWAKQVVVSEPRQRELADLMRVPAERIQVVPNGVDVGRFLKLEAQTQGLLGELNLAEASPLILLPVRITPRKNIELALRVLAVLRADFADARLLVTGPLGPHNPANSAYFERLLALREELHLEDAAHFLAEIVEQPVSDDVIADLYKVADLLFLPSREEGFGIPILEAGLAGIPVFCSDIAALRQLAAADAHYFPPDGLPAEIAREIAAVLGFSQTYAMRKRVLAQYTWDRIYSQRIAPLLVKG